MTTPLADLTTLRVGGAPHTLVTAETPADLIDAVTAADATGEPLLIVGGGSNIVVADDGFPGTVVLVRLRGIDATIDVQEPTTFFDNVLGGKIPGLFLFAWVPDYPDTLNFVLGQFGRDAGPTLGATYEAIDALATEASVTADPARRKAIYTEVNALIKELVPFVPVAHGGSAVAYRADVTGAHTFSRTLPQ